MRTLPLVALLTALLLAVPVPTRAQDKEPNLQQVPALSGLAGRIAAAKPNGGTAARFKPNGKRITLEDRVNALASSDDEKTSLRQLFVELFKGYEAEAKKSGYENDVAAAMAFYLIAHYSAYGDGSDPGDDITTKVVKQLQSALDTPEMRAASDEDKQKLYEYCVMAGGLTLAMTSHATEQSDADMRKKVRKIGGDGLETVTGVAPERVKITKSGLSITPDARTAETRPPAASTSPAPSSGMTFGVGNIAYRLPAGWSEKKGGDSVTIQRSFKDDYNDDLALLVLVPGWPKTERVSAAFPQAWRDLILSTFDGEANPFVYNRRIDNRFNCAFSFAQMKTKANGGSALVFLYLLDTGKAVYPIIGMFRGNESKFTTDVEQVFASLRIVGATAPGPLFTNAELVGTWSTSDRTYASYVNERGDYRGDASIATSSGLTLRADGTFSSNFMAIRGGSSSVIREKNSGTFKIEGDMLVLYDASGKQIQKDRILGLTLLPDGKRKMMIRLNPQYQLLTGNIGLYGEKYILVVK